MTNADVLELMARHEGPLGEPPDWAVAWARAEGATVWDVEGRRYIDLSAGFGAAAVGHANPRVVEAVRTQAGLLLHGLGDLHPTDIRARLAERLASVAPFGLSRMLFQLTGAGAIELAVKTAMLATGRHEVVGFAGAYHGTSFGALLPCGWPLFRDPFASALPAPQIAEWGEIPALGEAVACIVVEPMLGRGGLVEPPPGFLARLRYECDRWGVMLVVDEAFTGLGRCGAMWMCEAEGVRPDLLVCGKALAGGLPLSACLGTPALLDAAWGGRGPVAIDTHTHLGSPLSCAAALAVIDELECSGLPQRATVLGERVRAALPQVRGRGLALGLPCDAPVVCELLLRRGVIAVPAGVAGDVLEISPPLVIAEQELDAAIAQVAEVAGG